MRLVKHLNDDWKYASCFADDLIQPDFDDNHLESVRLPHTNLELPFSHFDETLSQFISGYRKHIRFDPAWKGKHALFHFEGVMAYARVYLNGTRIGEHKGGYTPFSCDGTDAVRWGEDNVLAVAVDANERPEIPPFGGVVDYLTYGGIYREVRLELVSALSLSNMRVRTLHVLTEKKSIGIDLYWQNRTGNACEAELAFVMKSGNTDVLSFSRKAVIPAEFESSSSILQEVPEVKLWSLSTPNLYLLEVSVLETGNESSNESEVSVLESGNESSNESEVPVLESGNESSNETDRKPIDALSAGFGFRDAAFRSDGFYLNGEKLKLRGLNHHQSFPYVGYAMPKSAQYKDVDILRHELGVNMVRLSHYPHSRHFLDRCDEVGLLVFEEIPGWQHIGGDEWRQTAIGHVGEMIRRDWNHPAIVLWGVRINESQDHDAFYQETNRLAHELDDTRQTGGVRNFSGSHLFEDVYTFNDFVHHGSNPAIQAPRQVSAQSSRFSARQGLVQQKRLKAMRKDGIRYLITEHNGHMFPTKKFDPEAKRVEQALRHLRVLDAMYGNPHISGALGWCMNDYNTHRDFGSGDGICHHGVMDMFRLPKDAAVAYASQQDEYPVLEPASSMAIGERDAFDLSEVYVFTNCEEVRLFKNDQLIGAFAPDHRTFPGLPHPPVVIRDFIGGLLQQQEGFTHGDAETIKEVLRAVARYGDKSLPLSYKLKMGWVMLKTRMNFERAVDLHSKYVANAGIKALRWKFVGIRHGAPVLTVERGSAPGGDLQVLPDANQLAESETYDVCRIVIRHVDALGNPCLWSRETAQLAVEGAGAIIGPLSIPITGGSTAFWVKTIGVAGRMNVTIRSDHFAEKTVSLQVSLRDAEKWDRQGSGTGEPA